MMRYLAALSLTILALSVAAHAQAKNWQVILVPSSDFTLHPEKNAAIAEGIAAELKQRLDRITSNEKVFDACTASLCGETSMQNALRKVAQKAPEVDLVLFYALNEATQANTLKVTLIDPLSFQEYEQFELDILKPNAGELELTTLKSLASDLGRVVGQGLQSLQQRNEFLLVLRGFSLDELAPLTTFVLSDNEQTKLRLLKSEKLDAVFDGYLPTVHSEFIVTTALTQSQFHQLLKTFFDEYAINIVSEFQRIENRFVIQRVGNPYTPSLISTVLFVLLTIVFAVLMFKRQMYHHQLEKFADAKAVDNWLKVYADAKSPWYFLRKKWGNQFNYWQRLQRESQELEKQAKLFFEAGDVITAKLFISKALNINANAALASQLVNKIEQQESSQKAMSEKEHWVRNKVAKAMNNYRGNQATKALRQAYQALNRCENDKLFKRQYKAIKRLIQKINKDFAQSHINLELSDLTTGETCVVSSEAFVDIGRALAPEPDDISAPLLQDGTYFFLNHKALSRAGKQCRVYQDSGVFYIQDLGSTNGTFLNAKALDAEHKHPLKDQDIIYLGADSELTAVKLKSRIDPSSSLVQLRIDKQLQHTLDIADLARVWPDYVHAMRASLVMTEKTLVLAIDKKAHILRLVSEHESKQKNGLTPLVKIELGEQSSVETLVLPERSSDSDDKAVKSQFVLCNNEVLLGRVPLITPCEIKWQDQHVYIDGYLETKGQKPQFDISRYTLQDSVNNHSKSL